MAQAQHEAHLCVSPQKSVPVTSRHVAHRTFDHTGHVHSFLVIDTVFLTNTHFAASFNLVPIYDVPWVGLCPSAKQKKLVEYQDLAEHEDLRVKHLFFHRPSTASTYDSAKSTVTPSPDSHLDDEQIRALLDSPLYLQEREANAERTQVYHSARENLMSSSSQIPIAGRPVALFSSKNRSNQDTFSDREDLSLQHQQVFGNSEPLFRFSNPVNSAKSLLDGNRDHVLAEAKSELMKQECKVDSLNTCIRDLQRQAHSQRLEFDDAHFGYEESRRERVRLQEELALRERKHFEILVSQPSMKWKN